MAETFTSGNSGIYVEVEHYASSNFTSLPKSLNGLFDEDCSGLSCLHLYFNPQREKNLSELKRAIITPPGYLYLEIPLLTEESQNYKNFWISISTESPGLLGFQWAIFPKLDPMID